MNERIIPLSRLEQTLGSIVYHHGRIPLRSNANPSRAAYEYRGSVFRLGRFVLGLGKVNEY